MFLAPQLIARRVAVAVAAAALAVAAAAPAGLAATSATAGAISQSYTTHTSGITQGTLLSVTAAGSGVVSPASANANAAGLVGVAANQPLLELSSGGSSTVQVVVSGVTQVLVSDVNGAIKAGDKIAPSPLDGIGQKATRTGEIVGTAQADLSSVSTVSRSVTGADSKSLSVKVGLLPVAISVAYYSAANSTDAVSAFVPPFLQNFANALTGRDVSPIRVLAATLTLITGLVLSAVMLITSIRSEIISVGRNPLAHRALLHSLIDVIIAALGVLLISLVAAYTILVL